MAVELHHRTHRWRAHAWHAEADAATQCAGALALRERDLAGESGALVLDHEVFQRGLERCVLGVDLVAESRDAAFEPGHLPRLVTHQRHADSCQRVAERGEVATAT